MLKQNIKILPFYCDAPIFIRALVALRPFICPFKPIVNRIPPNKNILDIGCGVGALIMTLAIRGDLASAVGCDLNPNSIKIALSAGSKLNGEDIKFSVVTENEKIPAGPFDVVTLVDVMHHVPRAMQKAFFDIAVARVKPGGLLVYKDMVDRPLWKNVFNRLHDAILARQFINYVPLEKIECWGAMHGLAIEEKEEFSRFAYGHELLVFRKE